MELDLNIFNYTWRYSRLDQIWLLVIVVVSLPFYFYSLDLPKSIVNGPIQGQGFGSPTATKTAMRIAFDLPHWLFGGGEFVLFNGLQFGRITMLVYLCLLFLFFVLINGYFKLYISTFKGRLGERMLRRLRYQLIDRRNGLPWRRVARAAKSFQRQPVRRKGPLIGLAEEWRGSAARQGH